MHFGLRWAAAPLVSSPVLVFCTRHDSMSLQEFCNTSIAVLLQLCGPLNDMFIRHSVDQHLSFRYPSLYCRFQKPFSRQNVSNHHHFIGNQIMSPFLMHCSICCQEQVVKQFHTRMTTSSQLITQQNITYENFVYDWLRDRLYSLHQWHIPWAKVGSRAYIPGLVITANTGAAPPAPCVHANVNKMLWTQTQ